MKTLCLVLLAAVAIAGEETKKPTLVARRERNEKLTTAFAASCAEVRIWFRLDDGGEPPEFQVRYLCPNCNSYHYNDADDYLRLDRPFEGSAFALAPDRFLVQDQHLLATWVDRMEIVFGGKAYAAKPVRRYPDADALELKTDAPVKGVKPLVFSSRIDFLSDTDGVFYYSTKENGLAISGTKQNPLADFTHYADIGKDIAKSVGNAIAVNASNEAVTVSFRSNLAVSPEAFAPPAQWKGEPVEAFETRWQALEDAFRRSCVPLYLHLDDEDNRKDGFARRYGEYRDDSESTDIDLVGFALNEGEVLAELRLNASKMSEIDRIEARFPDGRKVPMGFVGAFADHQLAVFRFADGKLPDGVEPIRIDAVNPVARFLEPAVRVTAKNFGDKMKVRRLRVTLESFRLGRAGQVQPAVDGFRYRDSRDGAALLLARDGSVMGLSVSMRVGSGRYSSETDYLGASLLASLLEAREFDPQFAIRTGKDRVRIAWIGVETQGMTAELAREKKVTALLSSAGTSGALVTRVWADSPAAKVGLAAGDVLLNVRALKSHNTMSLADEDAKDGFDWEAFFGMIGVDEEEEEAFSSFMGSPWPDVESGVNETFTQFGIGKRVIVAYARDGVRQEATMTLEQAPVHYQTAKRIKNKALGLIVSDMTFEVRGYFKFDESAPGVVIAKVQPGNPAAIGGLRPLEILTHVNNEPVVSAKDFARKVKGKKDLTFAVRRLAATRVVRIELKEKENEK